MFSKLTRASSPASTSRTLAGSPRSLTIEEASGNGGASGRLDRLDDVARIYAFAIACAGKRIGARAAQREAAGAGGRREATPERGEGDPSTCDRKNPTVVMTGLVPVTHAAKLPRLRGMTLTMRGLSWCEAAV
jgi:hypothetical protein